MAWTEFTDEKQPVASTKRICFRCLQVIPAGVEFFHRRGLLDGVKKTCVFHEDCLPAAEPGEATNDAPVEDADDAVTSPPVTTPLATVAEAAEAADAQFVPTPTQLACLAHHDAIMAKSRQVNAARGYWLDLRDQTKEAKIEFNEQSSQLLGLINQGAAQTRLPFEDATTTPTEIVAPAAGAEWKSRLLTVLALPETLCERLAESAIETLGHLKVFWDAGRSLRDLPGIGESKDTLVKDRWADYGKEHPEIYGVQTAAEAAEGPADLTDDGEGPEEEDPFGDDPEYQPAGDEAA